MSTPVVEGGGNVEPNLVVEIAGLDKTFNPDRANAVAAIAGLDLSVGPREFVSIIGPSGCGKSTLLRLVGGLTVPTAGTVAVNGKSAGEARQDRDYGMVFQAAGLLDWRSATRNVELPLELMGWPKSRRRARAAEMLELVELSGFASHHPGELSGGMQQRVSIARALSFAPSLLLMDEPFGALDEMTREHMQAELLKIWRETATTVIFVTHSIPEAVFLSTRVAVMSPRPGRIAEEIPIELPERAPPVRDTEEFFRSVSQVRRALRSVEGR